MTLDESGRVPGTQGHLPHLFECTAIAIDDVVGVSDVVVQSYLSVQNGIFVVVKVQNGEIAYLAHDSAVDQRDDADDEVGSPDRAED
jgi:hypothetical protein